MKNFLTFTLLITAMLTLISCSNDENRVRQIVKEELSKASSRTAITDAYTIGPYSPAQRVGHFLFLSGQIALDQESGTLRNADIETETRQALDNLMTILSKAGCDSSDVVQTTVYLTDINDLPEFIDVWNSHFGDNACALTVVATKGLALLESKIEINILGVRDSGKIKKQVFECWQL